MEDLLEEIVGEIHDEHDDALIEKRPGGEERIFNLEGGVPVREANRKYPLQIPESDDYTTVAGFLIARAGRLLRPGDTVEDQGIRFTVERVVNRRILWVRVELPAPPAVPEETP
ncbi:MAG: transporter associated domain-containing protein [Blastocatellia bacterium]